MTSFRYRRGRYCIWRERRRIANAPLSSIMTRQKAKEFFFFFKRYQESLEPLEMCVAAAGNHGFGFGFPSSVTELLGSLFSFGPSNAAARVPQHCRGAVAKACKPALQRTSKGKKIKRADTESLCEVRPETLPLPTAVAQPTVSNTWPIAAHFQPPALYWTTLNEFGVIKLFASFIAQTILRRASEIISMNGREIEKLANICAVHLLRGEKEKKNNNNKKTSPCHASNLR